ncbi:MAG: hypothetical protein OZSIB_1211 [Candidatus Ozemobacter sibiricus]|uniref:Uncharacterized protein n=1 Tax=Candidatus Ozemobacter sibiricus TaxID=2268124 RepID=A0A367ZKR0_9BACT|nr:MAG: hypothetical protein OZSIB_1211 [Candidatus Ozemobacter sibiricus]
MLRCRHPTTTAPLIARAIDRLSHLPPYGRAWGSTCRLDEPQAEVVHLTL